MHNAFKFQSGLWLLAATLVVTGCKSAEPPDFTPPPDPGSDDGGGGDGGGGDDGGGGGGGGGGGDDNNPPLPQPDPLGEFLDPCEIDADCQSNFCILGSEGTNVCTIRCEGSCPDPNYQCSIYGTPGGDNIRLCAPLVNTLCVSCADSFGNPDDSKCGGSGNRCLERGDGLFCGRNCRTDASVCPTGYECQEQLQFTDSAVWQCVPLTDLCTNCIDNDRDGYGQTGDDCPFPGIDCDDNDPTINPGAVEICDGRDNNCDHIADENFDKYNDPENCGGCNITCQRPNMNGVCTNAVCEAGPCADGYHFDLDGNYENGCEYFCPFKDLAIIDRPDSGGRDTNCDGIDGDISRAVFVSRTGNDANAGTKDSPVRNLDRAFEIAQSEGKDQILLTSGQFNVTTLRMVDGIGIFGGYNPTSWQRNVGTNITDIQASGEIAVLFDGVTTRTEMAGLGVRGAHRTGFEQSSYGVWIKNSADFAELTDLRIIGGNAGPGRPGNTGASGQVGHPGNKNSGSDNVEGGADVVCVAASGSTPAIVSGAGGIGSGSGDCKGDRGRDGLAGGASSDGTAGGSGGTHGADECGKNCGWTEKGSPGSNGHKGGVGANGPSGVAHNNPFGSFLTGFSTSVAPNGGRGRAGGGGGGGGSGGADRSACGPGLPGAGGGSGGSGGCGGAGGTGGSSGGGSFGLIVDNSYPIFSNVIVTGGSGGMGGQGGAGGAGGAGGIGGDGHAYSGNWTQGDPGAGGTGGQGGEGGSGSGGSGGCGGPSIGIAMINSGTVADPDQFIISAGPGGQGGLGGQGGQYGSNARAANGVAGCTGASEAIYAY